MFSILTYGLSVALVGTGTVFCGLVILIGVIKGMEKVLPSITSGDFSALKNISLKKTDAPNIVIQTANVNDDAVVAAISAALMTILEEEVKVAPEKAKNTFVVRSIRRVGGTPACNRAGREEQVYSRL